MIGKTPASSPRLNATDVYEWLPGKQFLLHWVDGRLGGTRVRSVEVIGFDTKRRRFHATSYDSGGAVTSFTSTLRVKTWRITGKSERFVGTFSKGFRAMSGTWFRKQPGGKWAAWLTITLRKRGR